VPAAAVIPAPIAYIKVAAVKKLVVGFQDSRESVCSLPKGVCTGLLVLYMLFLFAQCPIQCST